MEEIMNELKKSFIKTDKKEYIGVCNDSCKPDSRATICVSVRRLKRILKAFEENDQPYVYLHVDDWDRDYPTMLRMSCREDGDCHMLALAKFVVAEDGTMKIKHNNNLIDDVAKELGF